MTPLNNKFNVIGLLLILVILPTFLISPHFSKVVRSGNLSEFSINPISNTRSQNISNSIFNLTNDQNELFFERNIDAFANNKTIFYLKLNSYVIYFLNSSIMITIHDTNLGKDYSIDYQFKSANNINPIGLSARKLSESYYYKNNVFKDNFEYSELLYKNIYKNIDLEFFINQDGLKYNFIVHPEGNPSDISINFITGLLINSNSDGLKFLAPEFNTVLFSDSNLITYQESNLLIQSQFTHKLDNLCKSNCFGFEVGSYNHKKDLIIDPYWVKFDRNITFSKIADNVIQVNGFQFDNDGNIVVLGQYDKKINETDIFVAIYSPNGTSLNIAYIGGSGNDSINFLSPGNSIQIDNGNNIYIVGSTNSPDLYKATNSIFGDYDGFLIKLDNNLNMLKTVYIGGSNYDSAKVLTIYNNEIFVSGITYSFNFKVLNGVEPIFNGGNYDSFIAKFDTNFNLQFSTYFGGNHDDDILDMSIDSQGNLILTGKTNSNIFNITNYAIQQIIGSVDATDVFIAKISNNGNSILYNTYFGGDQADEGDSILIAKNNEFYIAGSTNSENIGTTKSSANYTSFSTGSLGSSRIFIIKLTETDISSYKIGNYYLLGGKSSDTVQSIKFDSNANIVITGNTYSENFWSNIPIYSNESVDNPNIYVTKINTQNDTLELSSIVYRSCPVPYCVMTSQDMLIDQKNNIFILGNNNFVEQNTANFSWNPFIEQISSVNDMTPPDVEINGYLVGKQYSHGENLILNVTDDLSGISSISYRWNNGKQNFLINSSILKIPSLTNASILTVTAIDNAGNINLKPFTILLKGSNITNIVIISGSIIISIISAYVTIYIFWKYYYSKKRIKSKHLEDQEVKDYLQMIKKDKTILDEIKDKSK